MVMLPDEDEISGSKERIQPDIIIHDSENDKKVKDKSQSYGGFGGKLA